MGESQSRYSIVERLTKQKLDVMGAKLRLLDEIKTAEQEAADFKTAIDDEKKEIDNHAGREKRKVDRDMKIAEQHVQNLRERQTDKETMYDQKIKAIEEALKSIEDISKAQSEIEMER